MTYVDYDYQIMVTDVTVEQYANFLNEAIASGDVTVGEFEVEAGEVIWHSKKAPAATMKAIPLTATNTKKKSKLAIISICRWKMACA